jgi:predicted nuclease with RNAse H fold
VWRALAFARGAVAPPRGVELFETNSLDLAVRGRPRVLNSYLVVSNPIRKARGTKQFSTRSRADKLWSQHVWYLCKGPYDQRAFERQMLTLGIDLASDDRNTATCAIQWSEHRALVAEPCVGRSNTELVAEIKSADIAAIDAPFGWPDAFVSALSSYHWLGSWPQTWPDRDGLSRLRFRDTDLWVGRAARVPLSVSSERIAVCAFRCAALLEQASGSAGVDRTGSEKVCEVYPAAALKVWGFDPRGYKRALGTTRRNQLLTELVASTGDWLTLMGACSEICVASDHAFDALVAALVGRAVALGQTTPPPRDEAGAARAAREGWIHLPVPESLGRLL